MAYVHFTPSVPIADNTGPEFVDSVEKNLQALRDIGIMGIAPDWNMTDDSVAFNVPKRLRITRAVRTSTLEQ